MEAGVPNENVAVVTTVALSPVVVVVVGDLIGNANPELDVVLVGVKGMTAAALPAPNANVNDFAASACWALVAFGVFSSFVFAAVVSVLGSLDGDEPILPSPVSLMGLFIKADNAFVTVGEGVDRVLTEVTTVLVAVFSAGCKALLVGSSLGTASTVSFADVDRPIVPKPVRDCVTACDKRGGCGCTSSSSSS